MSRMTMLRAIGALATVGLMFTAACSEATSPVAYTGTVDFGKRPKKSSPKEGIPDPEYVEACAYYDVPLSQVPSTVDIEFLVDPGGTGNYTPVQRDTVAVTIRQGPNGQFGYGCTDLWINGGTVVDNVKIVITNPQGFGDITHATQKVVRLVAGNPSSDTFTWIEGAGAPGGQFPTATVPANSTTLGQAQGNTGTTTTFLIKP